MMMPFSWSVILIVSMVGRKGWVVGSFFLAVHLIYSNTLSSSLDAIVINTPLLQSKPRDFSTMRSFYSTTNSLFLLPGKGLGCSNSEGARFQNFNIFAPVV